MCKSLPVNIGSVFRAVSKRIVFVIINVHNMFGGGFKYFLHRMNKGYLAYLRSESWQNIKDCPNCFYSRALYCMP